MLGEQLLHCIIQGTKILFRKEKKSVHVQHRLSQLGLTTWYTSATIYHFQNVFLSQFVESQNTALMDTEGQLQCKLPQFLWSPYLYSCCQDRIISFFFCNRVSSAIQYLTRSILVDPGLGGFIGFIFLFKGIQIFQTL